MREPAAIVAPAIDVAKIGAEVRKAHIALRDAEAKAKRDADQAEKSHETARRCMRDLGAALIRARKSFPAAKAGPKAKPWGDFLRDCGIESQRASEAMRYAGFIEEHSPPNENGGEYPSMTAAGVKPRKSEPRESDELAHDDGPNFPIVVSRPEIVSPERGDAEWMDRLAKLVEDMQRHIGGAFRVAEEIDVLCADRHTVVSSPALLTTRSKLFAVRAAVADVIRKMGGPDAV